MFYDFPQTRTERSLIQLKLKVTTRKSTGSYIYFLNAALHHSILKVSMCTIKYYWCMANPSKPNFHDWCDPSESLACFALTQVIAEALQLEIVPGGAGSWFFSFPITWPFSSLPANIKQHGVMSAQFSTWQHFYGISPLLQNITCPHV